jgi:hypothetical protein
MIRLGMKKLSAIATASALFFSSAVSAFAQNGRVTINTSNIPGYKTIGAFISAALTMIFIIALIAVLVMLVWGALQWIFSGGEKDAVASARNRILHALIGLAVLAVAIALVSLASSFVGVNILAPGGFFIPNPSAPTPVLPAAPANGEL